MRTPLPLARHTVRLIAVLPLLVGLGCGGGGGGGGDPEPPPDPGPDVTPPKATLVAPTAPSTLLRADVLPAAWQTDDDRGADVRVFLDADAQLVTTADQIDLWTGTDSSGVLVEMDLSLAGAPIGTYALFVEADDGTNAPVTDGGPLVIVYAGLAGVSPPRRNWLGVLGPVVAFTVGEQEQGQGDLNGDGDLGDGVVALLTAVDGAATNSGFTADVSGTPSVPATTHLLPPDAFYLAWPRREADEGMDLNGDGDASDTVVAYASDLAVSNLTGGASIQHAGAPGRRSTVYDETQHGADLNGDGDALDLLVLALDHPTNTLPPFGAPQLRPASAVAGTWQGFTAYLADEATQGPGNVAGVDLNFDGDVLDTLPVMLDVAGPGVVVQGTWDADPTAALAVSPTSGALVSYTSEAALGADVNGDMLTNGFVPTVNMGGTQTAMGSGLDAGGGARFACAEGQLVVYLVSEPRVGMDLNGDGDTLDQEVLFFTDPVAAPTIATPLGLPPPRFPGLALDGGVAAVASPGWLSIVVTETANGMDLNDDGDLSDEILILADLRVNPPVLFNTELATLAPASLPLPGGTLPRTGIGDAATLVVQAAETANGDLNGDGDESDTLVVLYDLGALTPTQTVIQDTGALHAYVAGGRVGVTAVEALGGEDLDDNGDLDGVLFRVFDATGAAFGDPLPSVLESVPAADVGDFWAYLRSEAVEGADLNDDGDQSDVVVGILGL